MLLTIVFSLNSSFSFCPNCQKISHRQESLVTIEARTFNSNGSADLPIRPQVTTCSMQKQTPLVLSSKAYDTFIQHFQKGQAY